MAERSEEYEILKNYVNSLHYQLTAFQNSSERIVQEYESLKTDYMQMKFGYDLQMRDFQVLVKHVDHTIEFLRMVSKRANGFAEWAANLRVNFFSMQPHADDLNRFLKMICREVRHFGRIEHLEAQAKIQDMGQNENTPAKQKLDVLEERLRAIEGTDVYGKCNTIVLGAKLEHSSKVLSS
ncbi:girdin-like [Cucumis melo var. makuwa]|uniref:Girdin-like n=1 Tax=Cucumis melo var. makuwa TaxID=1194695 RepID=A0A5D3DIY8_CUCMM|nr:girdin-like [Cucumis melo var. makuwa]TYK23340.1 girdin-like [Cucumis melo var. makuwa]